MQTPLPALAEASRTVGGPQIRNRGTIGGNLGTSSPRRTHCRRCSSPTRRCVSRACAASARCRLQEFVVGSKRNALADDELILDVTVDGEPVGRRS
jgi:CO/xanthine dehydrogenase FAD-binding subunit